MAIELSADDHRALAKILASPVVGVLTSSLVSLGGTQAAANRCIQLRAEGLIYSRNRKPNEDYVRWYPTTMLREFLKANPPKPASYQLDIPAADIRWNTYVGGVLSNTHETEAEANDFADAVAKQRPNTPVAVNRIIATITVSKRTYTAPVEGGYKREP